MITHIAREAAEYVHPARIKHLENMSSAAFSTGFREDPDHMRDHAAHSHVISRPKSYHNIFLPQDAKGGQRPEQVRDLPYTLSHPYNTHGLTIFPTLALTEQAMNEICYRQSINQYTFSHPPIHLDMYPIKHRLINTPSFYLRPTPSNTV